MDGSLSLSASLIKIKLSDICAILGCEYMGEDFLVDGCGAQICAPLF